MNYTQPQNFILLALFSLFSVCTLAQSPGGVGSGLNNWYRADSGTSSSSQGAPIMTWADSGPNGLNGTQTYFWNSPFYQEDVFNFHPALRFYGDWSWLNADLSVLSTGEYTVFVVSERSAENSKGFYLGIQQGSPKGFHMGYKSDGYLTSEQFKNDTKISVEDFGPEESPRIHRVHRYASGAMAAAGLINGVMDTDSDISSGGYPEAGQGRIGKGYDNNGFNGLISEVIIYNRVLSTSELKAVESYLSLKYGATIPTTRNNFFSNNTYNYNVHGLVRDDAKALNNPKSRSEEVNGVITLEAEGLLLNNTRLLIGNNNGPLSFLPGGPTGVEQIFQREWLVEEFNEMGQVALTLETADLGIVDPTKINLIIDTDGDGYNDETLYTGTLTGTELLFSGVDLEDNNTFTFAEVNSTYYAMADGNISDVIWKTSPLSSTFLAVNFDETKDMVITPNVSVTNDVTDLTVRNVLIDSDGTLIVEDNQNVHIYDELEVYGDLQNGESHFYFEGETRNWIRGTTELYFYDVTSDNTAGLRIANNTVHISNILTVVQNYFRTNNNLVLDSDGTRTGMIAPLIGASVIGNVTFNRFHNAALNGYVMVGSPIKTQTVNSFNDDFITTGFPGSDYPGYPFNNIKLYDESLTGPQDDGFYGVTGLTDNINPGTGTMIYMAAGSQNIDLTGRIQKGNINLPVSYTDNGTPTEDGWSLVANPYPCTIDWDSGSWTKTNLDNWIQVYDAANQVYMTYINGVGNNGGSRYIAPGQAFWVKANAPSPFLRAREYVKAPIQSNFKNGDELEVLSLGLTSGSRTEEVSMYWNEEATMGYDPEFDAKHMSAGSNFPSIGVFDTDGNVLSISAFPTNQEDLLLPLNVFIPTDNNFIFNVEGTSAFGNGRCLKLVDMLTGISYALTDGTPIELNIEAGNYADRFFLGVTTNVLHHTSDISCYGSQDGEAMASVDFQQAHFMWVNESGDIILEEENTNESHPRNLKGGLHTLTINGIPTCETISAHFNVEEPSQIMISPESSLPACPYSDNGLIEINSYGGVGLHSYTWQDGTEGPILSNLSPGSYTVMVKDERECEQDLLVALQAEEEALAAFSTNLESYELVDGLAEVNFINESDNADSYFWEFGDGTSSEIQHPSHTYTGPGEYRVILTVFVGECEFVTSKKILVQTAQSTQEEDLEDGLQVFVNGGSLIIQGSFGSPRDLQVRIFNTIGQQLRAAERISIGSNQVQIPVQIEIRKALVEIMDLKTGERMLVNIIL